MSISNDMASKDFRAKAPPLRLISYAGLKPGVRYTEPLSQVSLRVV